MGFTARQENFIQQHPVFQPYQIVCLEHAPHRLYAEVVQLAERRPVCWVRPLMLVEEPPEPILVSNASISVTDCCESDSQQLQDNQWCYYDLRDGSDLLLPPVLFRLALDTEVLPLLSLLYAADTNTATMPGKHRGDKKFSQFLQQVCRAYPEAF